MFPFVAFGDNKLVPTSIATGESPTEGIKHNFIVSYARGNTPTSTFDGWGAFGYWDIPKTVGEYKIEVFKRDGTRPSNGGSYGGTAGSVTMFRCTNGVVAPKGNKESHTTAYFTKSGAIIWHQENTLDPHDGRIENDFMIPHEASLSNINQINGNYIGYVITGNGQSNIGNTSIPVKVEVTDGTLVVKDINVTSNNVGDTISKISLTTEVTGTKGLWRGQVTTVLPSATEGIGCAIDLGAGGSDKNVIICGGMLPDGTLKQLYSLILVSK